MKTSIGFLAVGSYVKKGGQLFEVIAINDSEVTTATRSGFVIFDTPVLDLQDVRCVYEVVKQKLKSYYGNSKGNLPEAA